MPIELKKYAKLDTSFDSPIVMQEGGDVDVDEFNFDDFEVDDVEDEGGGLDFDFNQAERQLLETLEKHKRRRNRRRCCAVVLVVVVVVVLAIAFL